MNIKIIRISDLTIDEGGCKILHDTGYEFMGWLSVSFLFLMISKKTTSTGMAPDLFFYNKKEKQLVYIDSTRFNFRKFLGTDSTQGSEKNLSLLVRKILPHMSQAYPDETLDLFLEGKLFELPFYIDDDAIVQYLLKVAERAASSVDARMERRKKSREKGEIQVHEWEAGDLVDEQFKVKEVLKGGMGIVYIVNDLATSTLYALKTIQQKFFWDRNVYNMFVREAEVWVKLEKHPHIVQAHFVKIIGGCPFIYLEYIKGTTLDNILKGEPLPLEVCLDFAIQFTRGMEYAFSKLGIVHRDIKPSNCMITEEGILKISDFGLACLFSNPVEEEIRSEFAGDKSAKLSRASDGVKYSATGALQGTLPYMAPERFLDPSLADICSDIYAFGVMLYEMVTGMRPIHATDLAGFMIKHTNGEIPEMKRFNPETPAAVERLTMKCLAREPSDRYQSFGELEQDLLTVYRKLMKHEYTFNEIAKDLTPVEWTNKGLSLMALGRMDEALQCYEKALRQNHRQSSAWLARGNALYQLEQFKDALTAYNKLIEIDSESQEGWLRKGLTFFSLKRFQDALTCYNRAIELNPRYEEAWLRKGLYYIEFQKHTEGFKCFDEALKLNVRCQDALFYKGKALLDQGKPEEALPLFNSTLDLNPRRIEVWLILAEMMERLGRYDEALSSYEKVTELDASHRTALMGKARLILKTGEIQKAREILEKLHSSDSENREIRIMLFSVYDSLGWYGAALDILQAVLDVKAPDAEELLMKKGRIHEKLSELDEAITCYRLVLSLCPDNSEARFSMESLLAQKDRRNAFIETLFSRKTVYPEANDPAPPIPEKERSRFQQISGSSREEGAEKLLSLGISYFDKNDLWMALQCFMNALMKGLENPKGWLWMGTCLVRLAFPDNALSAFGRYLRLMPKSQMVWREVARLYINKREINLAFLSLFSGLKYNMDDLRMWLLVIAHLEDMGGWSTAGVLAEKALEIARHRSERAARTEEEDSELSLSPEERKCTAFFEIANGKYDRAIKLIDEILKENPQDLVMKAHRGDVQKRRGDLEAATRTFYTIDRNLPKEPSFLFYAGLFHYEMMNPERALFLFEKAISMDESFTEAHIGRALLLYGRGDCHAAIEALNRIISSNPLSNRALELKAIVHAHYNEIEEAQECLDEGLANNKYDGSLIYNKIVMMRRVNAPMENILALIDHYRSCYPLEVDILNMQSSFYLEEGDTELAERSCDEALNLDPNSPKAWNNIGVLYARRLQLRKAKECFDQALLFENNLIEALNNKSAILMERGELDEAMKCMGKLFSINSHFGPASYNRATILCRLGNYDEALQELERAERIVDCTENILINRAICHFLLGNMEASDLLLVNSVRLDEENYRSWFLKGLTAAMTGRYDEALPFFEQAVSIKRDYAYAWLCKGVALNACGNMHQARDALKKAEELQPELAASFEKDELYSEEVKQLSLTALSDAMIMPVKFMLIPNLQFRVLIREAELLLK
ncbi:MAG: tetratricopeptide repeat protein [Vulcanimicrobiota bacterium]